MFEVFQSKRLCNPCPLELCSQLQHIVVKHVWGGHSGLGITQSIKGLLMTRTDSPGAMNSPSNDG